MRHLMLGTAGHIDHGKTSLVKALTGVDTDRLPEEKRRGISIDLGFADWQTDEFQFGIVDVPGHQKFIRNMVAGASGIDFALLVIAADDSVMPQTREHLQIMQHLGIPNGLVALTKSDLADAETREFATEEIRELIQGTFLESAPIVAVSSATGDGIEELKAAIIRVARCCAERISPWDLFRMPVDRVFSRDGHGTIVTGSVLSGNVSVGDRLELLPHGLEARVRNVQNHKAASGTAGMRQRTAVNVASVRPTEVSRGHELVTPGWLQPSHRILASLASLTSGTGNNEPPRELHRRHFLLHLGTSETAVRVSVKVQNEDPAAPRIAVLHSRQPMTATYGQRFVLRTMSQDATVCGGFVLDPIMPARRLRKTEPLAESQPAGRVAYLLAHAPGVPSDLRELAIRSGSSVAEVATRIAELRQQGQLMAFDPSQPEELIHVHRLKMLERQVVKLTAAELEKRQPRKSLPESVIMDLCRPLGPRPLLKTVLQRLIKDKKLQAIGGNLTLQGMELRITRSQQKSLNQILAAIQAAAMTPPNVRELCELCGDSAETVLSLLDIAAADQLVIRVDRDFCFDPQALDNARVLCLEFIQQHGPATMAQLRDVWGVTRKHAIPLGEFFDQKRITVRDSDLRIAGPASQTSFAES